MVVQDRNYRTYNNGVPTADEMFTNLFGYRINSQQAYLGKVDVCLLPYNPMEPGRFRIIRDFRMTTAPGWRSDVYKRITILQSRTNSKGRIYFGPGGTSSSNTTAWTTPVGGFSSIDQAA